MSDDRRLICTPVRLPAGVRGAVKITAGCGHAVWISPSGIRLTVTDPSIRAWCQDCVPRGEPLDLQPPNPDQKFELDQEIGKDVADAVVKMALQRGRQGRPLW